MSAFETARQFFENCETSKGWEGCKQFVAPGATFEAQCEPCADIETVEGYCEWMKAFGSVTAPGATYDLHAAAFDEDSRTALFFATIHATHTGDGGPVPPTGKSTHATYLYALRMGDDDKVVHFDKVWNAPWSMKELGWM